jgi:hypothetical protein
LRWVSLQRDNGRIRKRGISIVFNPDYDEVCSAYPPDKEFIIKSGLFYLTSRYTGEAATVRSLIRAGDQDTEKIIYPSFGGQRGHPPLIPLKFAPSILELHKEGGLKAFLEPKEKLAVDVPVADSLILFDIDTPEDYAALQERFRCYDIPTDEECRVILNDICKVDPDRTRHSAKVAAELAVTIGSLAQGIQPDVNVDIIREAALLHDIAKGQRHHDIAGGKLLRWGSKGGKYRGRPTLIWREETSTFPGNE